MLTLVGFSQETVTIGDQVWMKQNINVGAMLTNTQPSTDNQQIEKYCMNNLESNCTIYGGLYSWDEMMTYSTVEGSQGICPTGFHVPTKAEFRTLALFTGGTLQPDGQTALEGTNGKKLREAGTAHWMKGPRGNGTDDYGFSALGTGYKYNNSFASFKTNGYFWTSTPQPSQPTWIWFRGISFMNDYLTEYMVYKTGAKASYLPLRCIKD